MIDSDMDDVLEPLNDSKPHAARVLVESDGRVSVYLRDGGWFGAPKAKARGPVHLLPVTDDNYGGVPCTVVWDYGPETLIVAVDGIEPITLDIADCQFDIAPFCG